MHSISILCIKANFASNKYIKGNRLYHNSENNVSYQSYITQKKFSQDIRIKQQIIT